MLMIEIVGNEEKLHLKIFSDIQSNWKIGYSRYTVCLFAWKPLIFWNGLTGYVNSFLHDILLQKLIIQSVQQKLVFVYSKNS